MEPCSKTEMIDMIHEDLRDIKKDIRSLLEFKNRALGIILTITAITNFLMGVILILIRKI